MTKDSYDGKSHSSTVTESVTNKNPGWEPVVLKKGERARYKWNHKSEGEHVVFDSLSCLLRIKLLVNIDFNDVMDNDKASYDDSLPNFNTINSCINVNCISAEDGNVSHIDIVYNAKVNIVSEDWSQHDGDDNMGQSLVSNEEW